MLHTKFELPARSMLNKSKKINSSRISLKDNRLE